MRVFWGNVEKTILVREFLESFDWEEYQESILIQRQMLSEVQHPVFIIIDGTKLSTMPRDAMSYLSDGNRNLPSHVALRVLVTTHKVALATFSMLHRIFPDLFENYLVVSTMAEAYEKIQKAMEGR